MPRLESYPLSGRLGKVVSSKEAYYGPLEPANSHGPSGNDGQHNDLDERLTANATLKNGMSIDF